MAHRSLAKRLWYGFLQTVFRLGAIVIFRIRCRGREHLPSQGAVLVLANHQSNMDPVLVGLATNRRLNYLARETLFAFAPFRLLIRSLDAIPIDREGLGLAGIKETLRRLKRGEAVLIFPEGTRTRDGRLQPLKPGFCALARRAGAPLAPVAIAGAFDAWPRSRLLPRRSVLRIEFGAPLWPADIDKLTDEGLITEVERRIAACFASAESSRRRATG